MASRSHCAGGGGDRGIRTGRTQRARLRRSQDGVPYPARSEPPILGVDGVGRALDSQLSLPDARTVVRRRPARLDCHASKRQRQGRRFRETDRDDRGQQTDGRRSPSPTYRIPASESPGGVRSARCSPKDGMPTNATSGSCARPVGCIAWWKHAREVRRELIALHRIRDLPGLRVRLRRPHRAGQERPDRGRLTVVPGGPDLVRGRLGTRCDHARRHSSVPGTGDRRSSLDPRRVRRSRAGLHRTRAQQPGTADRTGDCRSSSGASRHRDLAACRGRATGRATSRARRSHSGRDSKSGRRHSVLGGGSPRSLPSLHLPFRRRHLAPMSPWAERAAG